MKKIIKESNIGSPAFLPRLVLFKEPFVTENGQFFLNVKPKDFLFFCLLLEKREVGGRFHAAFISVHHLNITVFR